MKKLLIVIMFFLGTALAQQPVMGSPGNVANTSIGNNIFPAPVQIVGNQGIILLLSSNFNNAGTTASTTPALKRIGDTQLVVCGASNASGSLSVSDVNSTSWTSIVENGVSNAVSYSSAAITSLSSDAVTCTAGGSGYVGIAVFELYAAWEVDSKDATSGTGTSAAWTSGLQLASPGDLVLSAVITTGTTIIPNIFGAGSSFVTGSSVTMGLAYINPVDAINGIAAGGTAWSWTGSVAFQMSSIALRPPAVPVGGMVSLLGEFLSSPPTLSSGQIGRIQLDSSGNANIDLKTALPAGTNNIGKIDVVGNSGASFDAAIGAAPPANAIYVAGLGSGATGGDLTGLPVADTYKDINVSTATTTLLVTGVSGRQVRIGAIHFLAAGADNVALIEGTGATCGTGTAGMAGGTTATSGYNLAANGGISIGSGVGTVLATVTSGDSVCVVTSAAVQLSGGLEYTIY